MMKNKKTIALQISYAGNLDYGFQRQKFNISIQEHVETALFKLSGVKINIICAGRTDKGVHASAQIVHFILEQDRLMARSLSSWRTGMNYYLPNHIHVCEAYLVKDSFHARYSAKSRTYHYYLVPREFYVPWAEPFVTFYYDDFDARSAQQAANMLVGEHDFASFAGRDSSVKSTVRNLLYLNIIHHANGIYCIDISANGFLQHMVRKITYCLVKIGQNQMQITKLIEILNAQDSSLLPNMLPPNGLYFVGVCYSSDTLGRVYKKPLVPLSSVSMK